MCIIFAVVVAAVASFIDLLYKICTVLDISSKGHVIINLRVEKTERFKFNKKRAVSASRCVY